MREDWPPPPAVPLEEDLCEEEQRRKQELEDEVRRVLHILHLTQVLLKLLYLQQGDYNQCTDNLAFSHSRGQRKIKMQ